MSNYFQQVNNTRRYRQSKTKFATKLSDAPQYKEDINKAEEYFAWTVPLRSNKLSQLSQQNSMEDESSSTQEEKAVFYISQDLFGLIMLCIPAYPYYYSLRRVSKQWLTELEDRVYFRVETLDLIPRFLVDTTSTVKYKPFDIAGYKSTTQQRVFAFECVAECFPNVKHVLMYATRNYTDQNNAMKTFFNLSQKLEQLTVVFLSEDSYFSLNLGKPSSEVFRKLTLMGINFELSSIYWADKAYYTEKVELEAWTHNRDIVSPSNFKDVKFYSYRDETQFLRFLRLLHKNLNLPAGFFTEPWKNYLEFAVTNQFVEAVRYLVEEVKVNFSENALYKAIKDDNMFITKYLIEHFPSIDKYGGYSGPYLGYAFSKNRQAIAEYLFSKQFPLQNPIHYYRALESLLQGSSAVNGSDLIWLLEHFPYLLTPEKEDSNPLVVLSRYTISHEKLVYNYLFSSKIFLSTTSVSQIAYFIWRLNSHAALQPFVNQFGIDQLFTSFSSGKHFINAILHSKYRSYHIFSNTFINKLFELVTDPKEWTTRFRFKEYTLLHVLVATNQTSVLQQLSREQLDAFGLDTLTTDGNHILHLCESNACFKWILTRIPNIDINMPNASGDSLFMIAVRSKNESIVEHLLSLPINWKQTNSKNESALFYLIQILCHYLFPKLQVKVEQLCTRLITEDDSYHQLLYQVNQEGISPASLILTSSYTDYIADIINHVEGWDQKPINGKGQCIAIRCVTQENNVPFHTIEYMLPHMEHLSEAIDQTTQMPFLHFMVRECYNPKILQLFSDAEDIDLNQKWNDHSVLYTAVEHGNETAYHILSKKVTDTTFDVLGLLSSKDLKDVRIAQFAFHVLVDSNTAASAPMVVQILHSTVNSSVSQQLYNQLFSNVISKIETEFLELCLTAQFDTKVEWSTESTFGDTISLLHCQCLKNNEQFCKSFFTHYKQKISTIIPSLSKQGNNTFHFLCAGLLKQCQSIPSYLTPVFKLDTIQELLSQPNLITQTTPLHVMCQFSCNILHALLKQKNLCGMLMDTLSKKDKYNKTPMDYLENSTVFEAVKELIAQAQTKKRGRSVKDQTDSKSKKQRK